MHYGVVFLRGGHSLEVGRRRRHRLLVTDVAGRERLLGASVLVDDYDVLQVRKVAEDVSDAAPQLRRDHQHRCSAIFKPVPHGVRPECGEERARYGPRLEDAEECHVQLRHAPHEDEHPVALLHAEPLQHVGKAVGLLSHLGEGVLLLLAAGSLPVHGHLVAAAMVDVPVDGLVGQIKAAAGEAVKLLPELLPGEGLAQGVVSVQVGANGEVV